MVSQAGGMQEGCQMYVMWWVLYAGRYSLKKAIWIGVGVGLIVAPPFLLYFSI